MNKTLSHLCKGVFLALFFIACIACAAPSTKDTSKPTEKSPTNNNPVDPSTKDTEKTPDEQNTSTVKTIAFTSPIKTYKVGERIEVTVTFTEVVTVTGTPMVAITIGTTKRQATYESGSGGTDLLFAYTVVEEDEVDTDGIKIPAGTIALGEGSITDSAGNPATLTHEGVAIDSKRTVDTTYTFVFEEKELRIPRTENTYLYSVTETNKADSDKGTITYTSSSDDIATVDAEGTVTFKTAGMVTITATKDTAGDDEKVSDSYTLYITMQPTGKNALVTEIKRAMGAHGGTVDLNYIDTSLITDMVSLFSAIEDTGGTPGIEGYGLGAFNGDISTWDVRAVTNMSYMFHMNTEFNQDISSWWDKLEKVTNMYGMFKGATAFNGDISKWKVGSVTNMYGMFRGATAFNGDISRWDVSAVTNMGFMFSGATAFTGTDLNCWAGRIHQDIVNNWLTQASSMFTNSGVDSNPIWYRKPSAARPPSCKPVN